MLCPFSTKVPKSGTMNLNYVHKYWVLNCKVDPLSHLNISQNHFLCGLGAHHSDNHVQCTYLYSFHTQWKSGWLVILFNPTTPQSVPRSNNLTSSPDKRGFPTRNAASPLSSYLSCLLSHHITKNTKTTLTNTTTQHSTQHNTTRISSLLLSFLLLHHAVLNNTQQPQQQHWPPQPNPTTIHRN